MGNRQGGKMATRQEPACQHRSRKRTGKSDGSNVDEDPLSPKLHRAVFQAMHVQSAATALGSSPGGSSAVSSQSAGGGTFHADSGSSFVTHMLREEMHVTSCQPDDRLSPVVADRFTSDGADASDGTCTHPALHSPSARRRDVLQPSDRQNHQQRLKGECAVTQVFADVTSSPGSFPKRCCLEADPLPKVKGGVNSPAAVITTAASCIARLENLKRNIAQCNTENFTHFNNAGFAQLQSEADYDNADGSDPSAHRRNKSMSPNTTAWLGGFQSDGQHQSKAVRKLSEPSRSVHSTKNVIPGAWSKSAENSPVIVKRALPGSPVMMQRTPSQSPSVQRRFPANAAVAASGRCAAETLDSPKARTHVLLKALSKHQDCLEARESPHAIRQKVTAEICLPHVSTSPASVRKMPESPILFSTSIRHQGKGKDRGEPSWKTTGDRYIPPLMSAETSRRHCMNVFTSSSCSSSESESTERKLRSREEHVSPLIPPPNSSTSPFPAALCTNSPTPIQFCCQPKGTPIRKCTVGPQPYTAVVLASRDSQGSLQAATHVDTKSTAAGRENPAAPMHDCKDVQGGEASADRQPSSSGVTEDSIKQNSQSAVFGSVSPKLLRHRRLMKDIADPSDSEHPCPKQSQPVQIPTAKSPPRHGQPWCAGVGDPVSADGCSHVHVDGDERLSQLSHSAPSSFSLDAIKNSDIGGGANKTLGQRIREVINEATVGPGVNTGTPSFVFGKDAKVFSKDDIFASTNAYEKSCSYSFSSQSANNSASIVCNKIPPFRNVSQTGLYEERCQTRAAEEAKTKTPCSPHPATKSTAQDTHPPKTTGHFYQLSSSRDSWCSSCVSDSSQLDSSFHGGVVAELTRANLSQQSELLSRAGLRSRQLAAGQPGGGPVQRLVSSDTSDTLSTDRGTSCSSKRESSTSTATDDTLTSFKTRSTANSADYEDHFVLPESLVFIRSADRAEAQSDDVCAFELEQTTIKRKLAQGQLHEQLGAEHGEPVCHKTRKKRRKQLQVQSQIITASRQHGDGTLTRTSRADHRDVYSDEISEDDADFFSCKDSVSDLPSSRDDISDLPSSRDDISDLPSSRDDISDLPSSRDDISDLHSSRDDISGFPGSKSKHVFHRSDLQSSALNPIYSPLNKNRSLATTDCHAIRAEQASNNNNTHRAFFARPRSSSRESCESFLDTPKAPGPAAVGEDSGNFRSEPHGPNLSSAANRPQAPHSDVQLSMRSPPIRPRKRLTVTSPGVGVTSESESAEDVDSRGQIVDPNLYPSCRNDDDDDDGGEGKELSPLPRPASPESRNRLFLSCTIYNSACQSSGAAGQ